MTFSFHALSLGDNLRVFLPDFFCALRVFARFAISTSTRDYLRQPRLLFLALRLSLRFLRVFLRPPPCGIVIGTAAFAELLERVLFAFAFVFTAMGAFAELLRRVLFTFAATAGAFAAAADTPKLFLGFSAFAFAFEENIAPILF